MSQQKPPRFARSILYADFFLLARVFVPIAHWADYHWSLNHFDLAILSLKIGLVAVVAGSFASFLQAMSWMGAIAVLIALSNVWFARHWLEKLPRCSKDFEADPRYVPHDAIGFVLFPPLMRGSLAFVCFWIGGTAIVGAALIGLFSLAIQSLYLPAMVCMFYFAGSWPSGRGRKPKKEKAPAFLPEPSPT